MAPHTGLDAARLNGTLEALLMDIALRLQVSPTKHEEAVQHYEGLAKHVDRQGSPLQDLVSEIYPSGSFAIHAATLSRVKAEQHDVDAVLELQISPQTPPKKVIDTLYQAVKGEAGSKYHDFKIERNSRCVTVTYPDGVTVDLMPVVRLPGAPERAAVLFHHKPDSEESYLKEVNPFAFVQYFNANVEVSLEFASAFTGRRLLAEQSSAAFTLEKADTEPMPEHLPLNQKSPRVVALQLLKRFRDLKYRDSERKGWRKPPSVALAALALEAGPISSELVKELIAISRHIRQAIVSADQEGRRVVIANPAYSQDIFTDRWPESRDAQQAWASDLAYLVGRLEHMQREEFDPEQTKKELAELFGETAAKYAVESYFTAQNALASRGEIGVSQSGKPTAKLETKSNTTRGAAIAIAPTIVTPARPNTNMGGSLDDAVD